MKAFILKRNGGVGHLVLTDLPAPEISGKDVLIQTKAFSINRIDAFLRQSEFALKVFYGDVREGESIVPGWDISGIVKAVGDKVDGIRVGDEVFGLVNFFGRGRTNAEYVAAPASHLAIKPANVSHEEAAASGLTALTAWESMVTFGKARAGEKVLIHGAAGGVGHIAVQIAKHFGAYVIGTGSPTNRDFIKNLADEFIDYTKGDIDKVISDADLVLDPMPGPHIFTSLHAAKPGGRVISLLPYDDEDGRMAALVKEKNLFAHRVVVSSNGDHMKEIAQLLSAGVLKPHVSRVLAFGQLPLGHELIESGRTRGKIVVSMNTEG